MITREHIETLRNTGKPWTAIARCLGVSSKTLYRRRLEYGLQDSFSDITNEELEWNIRDILKLTPFSGVLHTGSVAWSRHFHSKMED